MLPLAKIRKDLQEIRYYYSRQKAFDEAFRKIVSNSILEKVQKYNEAVKSAPVRLFDLYINLYTLNMTQEALSIDLNYTPEYIQMLNKKLLLFLQTKISE